MHIRPADSAFTLLMKMFVCEELFSYSSPLRAVTSVSSHADLKLTEELKVGGHGGEDVWQELAELPAYYSALVILQGRLLAVGGCDSDYNPTSAIHQYNSATNSCNVVSQMSSKRYRCFATVLPDNTVVVSLVTGGIVNIIQLLTRWRLLLVCRSAHAALIKNE